MQMTQRQLADLMPREDWVNITPSSDKRTRAATGEASAQMQRSFVRRLRERSRNRRRELILVKIGRGINRGSVGMGCDVARDSGDRRFAAHFDVRDGGPELVAVDVLTDTVVDEVEAIGVAVHRHGPASVALRVIQLANLGVWHERKMRERGALRCVR